jgi:glycine amidinotransferase
MSSSDGVNFPEVNSYNEWDPLEEIIVGRVDGASVPTLQPEVKANTYPEKWWFFEKHGGKPFPEELIQPAAKELDEFSHVLEGEGVKVRRPDTIDFPVVTTLRILRRRAFTRPCLVTFSQSLATRS